MKFAHTNRQKKLKEFLIFSAILSVLFAVHLLMYPHIENITFTNSRTKGVVATLPFATASAFGDNDVRFTIVQRPLQTTTFRVVPDNCITAISVNSVNVPDICSLGKAVIVDWGPYLISGRNDVRMTVSDTLGKKGVESGFSMTPTGWRVSIFRSIFLIILYGYIIFTFAEIFGKKRWILTTIFIAGLLLRVAYVSVTPFNVRDYDTTEHFRYIQYIADKWIVPHAAHGWEFHQAPLYYYLMAIPTKVSALLGIDSYFAKTWIQEASLLFSILTLAVGIWTATLLLKKETTIWGETLFSLLIASSPVLIFASNRISNDGLYFLIAFIFLATLLRWWQSRDENDFILTSIIIGIGFLTRANAYVFLPILFLCCAARTDLIVRQRARLMFLALGIVTILSGWLIALRFFQGDFSRLLLTHDGNGALMHIENSASAFLTFNPLRILEGVYPNLWSNLGSRQFFWEHAYQSAFFGWWPFPFPLRELSRWMLNTGFGVLALAIVGILPLLQRRTTFVPIITSLFIFLSTFAYYRYLHACSCNQDVRYIPLIVPLVGYIAVLAAEKLHSKFRWIFRSWLIVHTALCFIFFIRIWLA